MNTGISKNLKIAFQNSEEWLNHSLNFVKNIWLIMWGRKLDLPPCTINLNNLKIVVNRKRRKITEENWKSREECQDIDRKYKKHQFGCEFREPAENSP